MARMYNRKEEQYINNNLCKMPQYRTAKECLVLILFFSPPPTCSILFLSSVSSGHSFTRVSKQEVLYCRGPLVYVRYSEKRQPCSSSWTEKIRRRRKKREKNEQHFPVLERFYALISFFFSFPIALMSCTINALTRPVVPSIMDTKR
jgi:hypothetical protein